MISGFFDTLSDMNLFGPSKFNKVDVEIGYSGIFEIFKKDLNPSLLIFQSIHFYNFPITCKNKKTLFWCVELIFTLN